MNEVMIELRWLECKTGNEKINEWGCYYDETIRILQQRVRYPIERWTISGVVREMGWTDWVDIPVVKENTNE